MTHSDALSWKAVLAFFDKHIPPEARRGAIITFATHVKPTSLARKRPRVRQILIGMSNQPLWTHRAGKERMNWILHNYLWVQLVRVYRPLCYQVVWGNGHRTKFSGQRRFRIYRLLTCNTLSRFDYRVFILAPPLRRPFLRADGLQAQYWHPWEC
jgi:hypothetical protein